MADKRNAFSGAMIGANAAIRYKTQLGQKEVVGKLAAFTSTPGYSTWVYIEGVVDGFEIPDGGLIEIELNPGY